MKSCAFYTNSSFIFSILLPLKDPTTLLQSFEGRAGLPVSSEGTDWWHLVDAFGTHKIEFGFSLQFIQTVFETFGLQVIA